MPIEIDRDPRIGEEIHLRRSYSTIVRSNGEMLPIEERLGKRILRSLAPESLEARRLLRDGLVALVMPDGETISGQSIDVIYERLSTAIAARLASNQQSPEWRRSCRDTLATIKRWKRALSLDH